MNEQAGRLLIAGGVILIIAGAVLLSGRTIPLGRLPGDIHIQKENFSLYIPVTSAIIVSVLLTLIFWLTGKR